MNQKFTVITNGFLQERTISDPSEVELKRFTNKHKGSYLLVMNMCKTIKSTRVVNKRREENGVRNKHMALFFRFTSKLFSFENQYLHPLLDECNIARFQEKTKLSNLITQVLL